MKKDTQVIRGLKLTLLTLTGIFCLFVQFNALAQQTSSHSYSLIPFSSEFVAFRHGSDIGTASLALKLDENKQYQLVYESDVSRFFFSDNRHETTTYQLQASNTLLPVSYQYKRTGTGPNKKLKIDFDHDAQEAIINTDNKIDIDSHVDNQLFRIDISRQLAAGISQFNYNFINYRGEKRFYRIQTMQAEELSLPYGKLNAIKVKVARETNKRETYAWFAPELNFALVRLQQFKENKEQGDIQLKSFSTQN